MKPFQEFPKWKYHAEKEAVIVEHRDAEADLGAGWFDNPAHALNPTSLAKSGSEKKMEVSGAQPQKKTRRIEP